MNRRKRNTGTSLFKQKNTQEFLTSQAKCKSSILNALSRAIKEVQYLFASQDPTSKGMGTIGDCRGSQQLCSAFEEVLRHGLKPNWFGQGIPTFWPIVNKISRKQAIEYIGTLQHAQSDGAKCRGWIRLAVNECSLESYINVICQDQSLLNYYETYSFVRDPEMVSALTHHLIGLSQITFKLTVDVASLEFEPVPEAHSSVPLRMNPTTSTSSKAQTTSSHTKNSHKRNRERTVRERETASADVDGTSTASSSCVSSDSIPADSNTTFQHTGSASDTTSTNSGANMSVEGEARNGNEIERWNGNRTLEDEVGYHEDLLVDSRSAGSMDRESTVHQEGGSGFTGQLGELGMVHLEDGVESSMTGQYGEWGGALQEGGIDSNHSGGEWERAGLEDVVDSTLTGQSAELWGTVGLEDAVDSTLTVRQPGEWGTLEDEVEAITGHTEGVMSGSVQQLGQEFSEKGEHTNSVTLRDNTFSDENYDLQDRIDNPGHDLQGGGMTLQDVMNHHQTYNSQDRIDHQSYDLLQERQGITEYEDTLNKDQAANSGANPFLDDSPLPSTPPPPLSPAARSPLSPTNPFYSDTASHSSQEEDLPSNTNPFLSHSPHESSVQPADHTHKDHAPFTSTNPFDVPDNDDESPSSPMSDHNDLTPPWPLVDATPPLRSYAEATSLQLHHTEATPPLQPLAEAPPTHPDVSKTSSSSSPLVLPDSSPHQHLRRQHPGSPSSSSSTPVLPNSPPHQRPGSASKPHSADSSPHQCPGSASSSNSPTPVLPKHLRGKRPGSASSSTRTQTTEDMESCSGSSIDLSHFMDATPSSSSHLSPSHLNSPEENFFQPEMTAIELQLAIDRLKVELGRSSLEENEDKQELRKNIVELQMKLQHCKDEEEEEDQFSSSGVKEVCGHKLLRQPRPVVGGKRLCEYCGKRVRGILRHWYLCKLCGFAYHKKCVGNVDRVCSATTSNSKEETPSFILEICPEKGLTHQHFRCASCNIAFNTTNVIARQCDYTGIYYCPDCHHNDQVVIPARVVHNWDFTPRKVCCKCCDLLERYSTKPLLKVQSINPLLYTYVQELITIETLRKDLLVMKMYFLQCPVAKEVQLLRRLDRFPHFRDGARRFSLMDLKEVHSGELLPDLTTIHREYAMHIRRECSVCSSKGFKCELCHSAEVLYPFDRSCRQCPKCRTIFHRNCYSEMSTCPKCSRVRHHKRHMS